MAGSVENGPSRGAMVMYLTPSLLAFTLNTPAMGTSVSVRDAGQFTHFQFRDQKVEPNRPDNAISASLFDDCAERDPQKGDGCDQPSGFDTRKDQ